MKNCPKCQTPADDAWLYCMKCGTSLAATTVRGNTLVMSATSAPPIDVAAIIRRARTSYGTQRTVIPHAAGVAHLEREILLLLIDHSGSMAGELDPGVSKMEGAIRAATTLVMNKHQIDPLDEIGVIAFRERANVLIGLCPLQTGRPQIIQAIQTLRADGGTDIDEALVAARDQFAGSVPGVVRRIVLLTDGHSDHSAARTAERLKANGVVLDVIAIGATPAEVDEGLLRNVATSGHYRFIRDQRTLVQHYTQLANKTTVRA